MPAAELLEWMEYERLEPFGQWRDNWHSAMIAHILANAHRDPKRPAIPFSDFMYRDPETVQRDKDQAALSFFRSKVRNG